MTPNALSYFRFANPRVKVQSQHASLKEWQEYHPRESMFWKFSKTLLMARSFVLGNNFEWKITPLFMDHVWRGLLCESSETHLQIYDIFCLLFWSGKYTLGQGRVRDFFFSDSVGPLSSQNMYITKNNIQEKRRTTERKREGMLEEELNIC